MKCLPLLLPASSCHPISILSFSVKHSEEIYTNSPQSFHFAELRLEKEKKKKSRDLDPPAEHDWGGSLIARLKKAGPGQGLAAGDATRVPARITLAWVPGHLAVKPKRSGFEAEDSHQSTVGSRPAPDALQASRSLALP